MVQHSVTFCRVMLLGKNAGARAQHHILQGDAVG